MHASSFCIELQFWLLCASRLQHAPSARKGQGRRRLLQAVLRAAACTAPQASLQAVAVWHTLCSGGVWCSQQGLQQYDPQLHSRGNAKRMLVHPLWCENFSGCHLMLVQVACGGTSSMCSSVGPQLHSWGKLKVSGDNTMYPKPEGNLSGWNIRSIACGATTFAIAADQSVITWCVSWGPAGSRLALPALAAWSSSLAIEQSGITWCVPQVSGSWPPSGARCALAVWGCWEPLRLPLQLTSQCS